MPIPVRRFLPRATDYDLRSGRADLLAGITVAVVALPLALGFGVTSGAGAAAGLYTAIVAGTLAAIFGGSRFQVSGPTGAMTVVLLPLVAQHGVGALAPVGILAGVFLVLLGFAGIGRAVRYIPYPVITGFTAGIAVIILLQQVPALLGVERPEGEQIVVVTWRAIQDATGGIAWHAPALGALTILTMVGWGRIRQLHSLPASMAALVVTTVASLARSSMGRPGSAPSRPDCPRRGCRSWPASRSPSWCGRRWSSPCWPRSRACCRPSSPTA